MFHADIGAPAENQALTCSKVMKTMAEGHLASLTDVPPNACRGSHSPNPNRSQKVREPTDAVQLTKGCGWLGDGQGGPGELPQELTPLSCQPWNIPRAMVCPAPFPSQGWALSSSVPQGTR